MARRFCLLAVASVGLTLIIISFALAASPFYEGKTVRIIVPSTTGGGFDVYSRLIGRYIGKYIPGNPSIVVNNVPGAGGLTGMNYTYKVAKPDGLSIGSIMGSMSLAQLIGLRGIEFDIRKFEYIGGPVGDTQVMIFSKTSGITSMEKLTSSKAPVRLGALSPGNMSVDAPKIFKRVTGLPIAVVEGYQGTPEISMAVESGEVAGTCLGWEGAKIPWRKALDRGDAVVVLQFVEKPHPELPNVPLAVNFVKTEEERQLIQKAITNVQKMMRPYAFPPGTPKELVQLMRKAFQDTMKDKEFLVEAEKLKCRIDPLKGEEIEEISKNLFELKPEAVAILKDTLLPKK